jgi:Ca2+-binding RTX toxin-like protein
MQRLFAIALLTGLSIVASWNWTTIARAQQAAGTADAGAEVVKVQDVTLRVTGITIIGSIDNRLWAATLSLFGCSWRSLGAAPLTQSYAIHGTDGDDTIRVLQSPTLWCNRLLLPATQNGRAIQVYGGDGDDVIYGGGSAPFAGNPNSVFGEAGDDTLYLGPGGARGEGGPGNDTLYGGDSAGDILLGGEGDDALCEASATVALTLEGGDGSDDTSCSQTASSSYSGIESTNCSRCGLAYD